MSPKAESEAERALRDGARPRRALGAHTRRPSFLVGFGIPVPTPEETTQNLVGSFALKICV